MPIIGRLIFVLVAVLLVIGAAVFLFFRSSMASEGIYKVKTAVGMDAAAPERHIVPEGFQGWVVVHFAVEGAPPLGEEDGGLVLEYPATGRLETSTPAPDAKGFLQRGCYTQTSSGLAPLSRAGDIWGEFSHLHIRDDGSAGRSSGFFVGSMTEFRATEWPSEHGVPASEEK